MMKRIIVLISGLIQFVSLAAVEVPNPAPLILEDGFVYQHLKPKSLILSTKQDLTLDSVLHWARSKPENLHHPKRAEYVWILFTLRNQQVDDHFLLEIINHHIQAYELYAYYNAKDSIIELSKGGASYPFFHRKIVNRLFLEDLSIKRNETITYVLKVIDLERETSLSARIWKAEEFYKHEARDNLFYNLYFGGLLFISVFALVIGLIMRMKLFYKYSLYALMMAIFMFDNMGFGYQFMYSDYPAIKRFLDVSILPILMFVFIDFASTFFDASNRYKGLYRIIKVFYILILINLIFWIITRARLDTYYYILYNYFLAVFTFYILGALAVKSFKEQRLKTLFFIAAILFLFFGGFFFALSDAGYLPMAWFPTNPLLMSSVVEFGIFTLALIYEINLLNRTKNELLVANAAYQKKMLDAFIQGTEKERVRLSGELHDNIGSRLALFKNRLLHKLPGENALHSDLNDLYTNVRLMSHDLSPGDFTMVNLKEYLTHYLQKFQEITQIGVAFYVNEISDLDENTSGQIFRIVQEATQNVQKHSKATQLEIQLIDHTNELVLTIDDNGQGFDMKPIDYTTNGISNMESRVKSLDGTLEISTEPGKGCHIMVKIPFDRIVSL